MPRLHSISISCINVTKAIIDRLSILPQLKSLVMVNCWLLEEALVNLKSLKSKVISRLEMK